MTVGQGRPQVALKSLSLACLVREPTAGHCARTFSLRLSFLTLLICLLSSRASSQSAFEQQPAGNAAVATVQQAPNASADQLDFELRILWGGGTARVFNGAITIDGGSLKIVRNLSLQADSIGSISDDRSGMLKVYGHSPSAFGGVDVRINGSPASRVTVRLDHPSTGKPIEHSFALSEVLQQPWTRSIDEQGNRVAAERQLQDKLRVKAAQETSLFQVGTSWRGTVTGYHTGLPAGDYQLTAKLHDLGSGDVMIAEKEMTVTLDGNGNFRSPSVEIALPVVENAYSIAFALNRKRFLPSFVSSPQSLERRVDLVVFDYDAQPTKIQNWEPVATIQPLSTQWWSAMSWFSALSQSKTLQQLPTFSDNSKRSVSHGEQSKRRIGELECLTLAPSAWQAYPLTIEHPNRPHRVRVRLPLDHPQQLIISLRDFHESGEPSTLNVDSGVVIGERQIATQALVNSKWAEHEVVFWPRSSQPYLLLMNSSSNDECSFAEIQLEVAEIAPFVTEVAKLPPVATQIATPVEANAPPPQQPGERSVTLYLSKPLLADAFGADRSIDPVTRKPLESWLTWHQAAARITHYMMNAGYNTLVLSAISDGGSLVPISRLGATARFDSGAFYHDGRSPDTKDFVELLSCHMDRCGLKLILAIDLNSRLSALEKFEGDATKRLSLFQSNLEGKEWQLDSQEPNRYALYNPLNDHVQVELEQIVREICTRYASHASFSGITLELSERSHFAFAGDRWGFDSEMLSKYEAATQSKLPPRENLAAALQGALRLSFLNWRARELSSFYVRLGDTVRKAKADAKLLINPLGMWTHTPSQLAYADPAAAARNLTDTLLAAGVDVAWLKQQPHVAVLRGRMDSPMENYIERGWLSRASSDPSLQFAHSGNAAGSVSLQLPVATIIPASEKLAGGYSGRTASHTYPIMSATGAEARRVFIEQLFYEDSLMLADGAWMPVQHDDSHVAQLRKTFLDLPQVPMRLVKLDGDESNFRMRTIKVGNNTYLQMINNASWTERVTMDVKIAEIPGVYEVLGGREVEIHGAATTASSSSRVDGAGNRVSTVWQFDLPAYDMIAFKITDPQFKLNNLMHSSDASVIDDMKLAINSFETQLAKISDSARAESLGVPGGDFEQWLDGGRPRGWMTSSLPLTTIGPENALPHSGSTCVVIENKNQAKVSAWLQSEQIRIPASGRVVVSAWVRSPSVSNQSQTMRLSLIGRMRDGRRYQRSHQFRSDPTNTHAGGEVAVDWGRRPVTMYVTDLPTAELTELYVAFDLVGPGKVWVDDVQAFEAYLDPDERVQIQGQLFLAKEKLLQNNAFAAEQLLNSYLARYVQTAVPPTTPREPIVEKQIVAPERAATNDRWGKPQPVLKQFRESMRERWQR